jgi:O-antigen ligase
MDETGPLVYQQLVVWFRSEDPLENYSCGYKRQRSLLVDKQARLFRFFSILNEYSLYGIIFFLPISKAIIEVLFIFALAGFLGKKIIKPDFEFLKSKFNLFLLLFILFGAFSLFNSGLLFKKSLIALFFKWGKYILLFITFQGSITTKDKIKNVTIIFLVSAALVGLDGIFQRFTGFDFFRHKEAVDMGNGVYALRAAFNNYNSLAAYLVVVLSLVVALIIGAKDRIKRIVLWFLLTILGVSFLFTFSRGGWVGFAFGLLLIAVLSRRSKRVVLFMAVFLAVIFIIPAIKERFMFIFKPGGDANRYINWQIAWNMIKEHPLLGKGIGTFMDYFPHDKTWVIVGYAHNCFLQIWAETGIFSLASFVLFLSALFIEAGKAFIKTKDLLLLGLLAGLFGFSVHSFFDTHFYSLQLAYLFWSMAGILASLIKLSEYEI